MMGSIIAWTSGTVIRPRSPGVEKPRAPSRCPRTRAHRKGLDHLLTDDRVSRKGD